MHVQAIVTTDNSSFFQHHVNRLNNLGVNFTTTSATNISLSDINEKDAGKKRNEISPKIGHNIPYYAYNSIKFYPRILADSMTNEFDLVHAYSGLTAPFALAQPSRPLVITFIGSDLMGNYLFGMFPTIAKLCANNADAVIVQNEQMAEFLDCESYILPNGVDFNLFRPMERDLALSEVGWSSDSKHILFPYGTERDVKNYSLAEKIAKNSKQKYSGKVEFHHLGNVRHENMPYYMNAADVVLITSKREGSPNTVKEALACNTPVVSTDVGDVKYRVSDVSGSKVCSSKQELVDGVLTAIETESCNGRTEIQDISWEAISEKHLQIYESVL